MHNSVKVFTLFFLFPAIAFSEGQIILQNPSQLTQLINQTGYPTALFDKEQTLPPRPVHTGGFDDFPGDDQGWGGSPAIPVYRMVSGQSTQSKVSTGTVSGNSSTTLRDLIHCLFGWITGGLFTAGQENDPPDEQNPGQNRSETVVELEAFRGMLIAIDDLLAQGQENIALVSDMDGTLLPHDYESGTELRRLFNEYLNQWRQSGKVLLIIVTRAEIHSANSSFFSQRGLPEPDVLVSAPSGSRSTVRVHPHPDSGLILSTLPGMAASHDRVVIGENQITISAFGQFSEDMNRSGYEVKNNKGSLIAWLFKLLSLPGHIVVAAGDTLDDSGLLQSARSEEGYRVFTGIVVGNADANLRGFMSGREHIHLSSHPCLFGVVDGLLVALRRLKERY